MKRFQNLTTKTKLYLYKTLVRPILEYAPVPSHLASKYRKEEAQITQNRALKWATGTRTGFGTTSEDIHELAGMEALNTRIQRLAMRVWEKWRAEDEDEYERVSNVQQVRTHSWWPRSIPRVDAPEEPIYVSR